MIHAHRVVHATVESGGYAARGIEPRLGGEGVAAPGLNPPVRQNRESRVPVVADSGRHRLGDSVTCAGWSTQTHLLCGMRLMPRVPPPPAPQVQMRPVQESASMTPETETDLMLRRPGTRCGRETHWHPEESRTRAQLAGAVAAPGPDGAVASQGGGLKVPGRGGGDVAQARHAMEPSNAHAAAHADGTITGNPMAVVTRHPDTPIPVHSQAKAVAGGDLNRFFLRPLTRTGGRHQHPSRPTGLFAPNSSTPFSPMPNR